MPPAAPLCSPMHESDAKNRFSEKYFRPLYKVLLYYFIILLFNLEPCIIFTHCAFFRRAFF